MRLTYGIIVKPGETKSNARHDKRNVWNHGPPVYAITLRHRLYVCNMLHMCVCVCMYVCMHVCVCVCVCMYICTCIYIYSYIERQWPPGDDTNHIQTLVMYVCMHMFVHVFMY